MVRKAWFLPVLIVLLGLLLINHVYDVSRINANDELTKQEIVKVIKSLHPEEAEKIDEQLSKK